MDAERAERHLRLTAERELRRVLAQPRPAPGTGPPPMMASLSRLGRVAGALIAVGALDPERVEAIAAEFRTALRVRDLDPAGRGLHLGRATRFQLQRMAGQAAMGRGQGGGAGVGPGPAGGPGSGGGPGAMTVAPAPAAASYTGGVSGAYPGAPGPAPSTEGWPPMTVIPVGRMVPFRDENAHGEVYFLSLAITPETATLPAVVRLRQSPTGPVAAARARVLPFQLMTAVDDAERQYHLVFGGHGGGPIDIWEGHFEVLPVPPPEAKWLQVISGDGEPTIQIDLEARPRAADVHVQPSPSTPGERLLEAIAQGLIVSASGRFPQLSDGLGDIVAALEAAGALSAFSPVPAQLAALCQRLDIQQHGITVPPAFDLPEPWTDVLAHYGRRHRPPGREGIAALPVLLPDLDGAGFGLTGLHSRDDLTELYVLARGLRVMPEHYRAGPVAYLGSIWWLRDNAGHWHAAITNDWREDGGGENLLRLRVYPPLGRNVTSIELMVSGTETQVCAHLPVSWWAAS